MSERSPNIQVLQSDKSTAGVFIDTRVGTILSTRCWLSHIPLLLGLRMPITIMPILPCEVRSDFVIVLCYVQHA